MNYEAQELITYIENEPDLALWGPRGQGKSIHENVDRRIRAGTFDAAKLPKLMGYLVEAAAKRYAKENHMGDWHRTFTVALRKEVARELADTFIEELRAQGDYDGPSLSEAKRGGTPAMRPAGGRSKVGAPKPNRDIKEIFIAGRRWFQKTYGNTYFTYKAYIYFQGGGSEDVTMNKPDYGYGDQYLTEALKELQKNGYLPKLRSNTAFAVREAGIKLQYSAEDVKRKKDLKFFSGDRFGV